MNTIMGSRSCQVKSACVWVERQKKNHQFSTGTRSFDYKILKIKSVLLLSTRLRIEICFFLMKPYPPQRNSYRFTVSLSTSEPRTAPQTRQYGRDGTVAPIKSEGAAFLLNKILIV